MSCDRRCFDENDKMFGHEECSTCDGRDDGGHIKNGMCKHVSNGKEFYIKQKDVAPLVHELDRCKECPDEKGGTTEKDTTI